MCYDQITLSKVDEICTLAIPNQSSTISMHIPSLIVYCLLCWGLTTRQPMRVILCRLPEKGRKEIEERVEEIKERDREERGTGMKVKKQKK